MLTVRIKLPIYSTPPSSYQRGVAKDSKMPGEKDATFTEGAKDSLRVNLPRAWVTAIGLRAGDRVRLVFDDVLLIVPHAGPQAERARRALSEVRP